MSSALPSTPSNPRVVVVGNSVAVLCRPKDSPCFEPPYAGRLQRLCRAYGAEVDVINQGRWFERIDTAWRRWDRDVAPFLPSVVIVNYGFVECQPFIVPHIVHRALLDWKTRTSTISDIGRRLVVGPGRRYIGRATTPVARAVGQRTHKLAPGRFDAELARYIRSCRTELGALVLVVGVNPPGENMLRFQPGIDERRARFDRIEREVVARCADPLVQFVDVEPIFETLGQTGASVDGIHLTPAGHELLADELSARIARHLGSIGSRT
jgi:lysophospholipase L1-like esterase